MGRVIFIGAGPGSADLITVRGAYRLVQADVVLFDALTDPALRELAPAAHWVHVGKRGFADSADRATPRWKDRCFSRHGVPARSIGVVCARVCGSLGATSTWPDRRELLPALQHGTALRRTRSRAEARTVR